MSDHVAWRDIRSDYVERAGGEEAVDAGRQELLAEVVGRLHRAIYFDDGDIAAIA